MDVSEAAVRGRWAELVAKGRCHCGRPVFARGLCSTHYHRWRKVNFWRLYSRTWEGGRRRLLESPGIRQPGGE